MSNIRRINIKEFREMGLLAEVNRTFFHPIGLALEVVVDNNGDEKLGGIWDYRNDPEGMLYGEPFPKDQVKKAQALILERHKQRKEALGYIFQEGGDED